MRISKFNIVSASALLACAGALALASPVAASPVPVSDYLKVFDGSGALVEQALAFEDGSENPGFIYTLTTAIDASQFGNATVLREADGSDSDIYGICTCGPGGALALGFASDSEASGVNFGSFPRTFPEAGPISATLYLDPALQAAGWTATFWSDSDVPEPAVWALMIVGFGFVGVGLRRRREQALAA